MRNYRRNYRRPNADRFKHYRGIEAKFDSTGTCGHPITKGDNIGYNGGNSTTRCAECWRRWYEENAEAARMESEQFWYR